MASASATAKSDNMVGEDAAPVVNEVGGLPGLARILEKYIGEKIVIIAARYQYWGRLAEVNPDVLVLAQAVAVEVSGPAQSENPQTIDPIGTSIFIPLGATECYYFPKWVNNDLPGDGEEQSS